MEISIRLKSPPSAQFLSNEGYQLYIATRLEQEKLVTTFNETNITYTLNCKPGDVLLLKEFKNNTLSNLTSEVILETKNSDTRSYACFCLTYWIERFPTYNSFAIEDVPIDFQNDVKYRWDSKDERYIEYDLDTLESTKFGQEPKIPDECIGHFADNTWGSCNLTFSPDFHTYIYWNSKKLVQ
jgi:hypothetical protein